MLNQFFIQRQLLLHHFSQVNLRRVQRKAAGFNPAYGKDFLNQALHSARNLKRARQILFPVAIYAHLRQHPAKLPLQYGHRRF